MGETFGGDRQRKAAKRASVKVTANENQASYTKKISAPGRSPSLSEYSERDWYGNLDKASNRADTKGLKALGIDGATNKPLTGVRGENVNRRAAMSEKVNTAAKKFVNTKLVNK